MAAHGDLLEQLPIRIPLSAIGPVFGGTASVDLDEEELATGTPESGTLKVRVLGFYGFRMWVELWSVGF